MSSVLRSAFFALVLFVISASPPRADAPDRWQGSFLAFGGVANRAEMHTNANGARLPQASGQGQSLILGHDWQRGAQVFGAEVAMSWGNAKGNGTCGTPAQSCSLSDNRYASVRGRVGLAQGRVLGFATFGVTRNRWWHGMNGAYALTHDRGVVIGLGAEFALRPRLSLRVDGEHMRLGRSARVDGARGRFAMNTVRLSLVARR
ncbi:MAG: outer membrane beta-barrel protein [Rhodobacteraceae bacterium]|nr:outer membrane beta-barrel protein [Paracoccaceae bacterium]TVR50083.1 MAG: hypothetical protein EA386_00810 [Paracoccaceae bacterium]